MSLVRSPARFNELPVRYDQIIFVTLAVPFPYFLSAPPTVGRYSLTDGSILENRYGKAYLKLAKIISTDSFSSGEFPSLGNCGRYWMWKIHSSKFERFIFFLLYLCRQEELFEANPLIIMSI